MEVSMLAMGRVFLMSVLLGASFGLCYDVLRIFRHAVGLPKKKAFTVIHSVEDFLFIVFFGICFSVFVYYTNDGILRLFMFIGLAIGFYVYSVTVGRAVIAAADMIIRFVRRAFATVARFVMIPIRHICRVVVAGIALPVFRVLCIPVKHVACKRYTSRRLSSYIGKIRSTENKINVKIVNKAQNVM